MHGLIDALIERDDCTVGIVSGREISELRERTSLGPRAWLAGAHGFEIEGPDGAFVHPAIDEAREAFMAVAVRMRKELHRFPGVAVERKRAALVLHTLATTLESGAARARALHRDRATVHRRATGASSCRPRGLRVAGAGRLGQGRRRALDPVAGGGAAGQPVVALYAGDDVTDEDAFEALGEGVRRLLLAAVPRRPPSGLAPPATSSASCVPSWTPANDDRRGRVFHCSKTLQYKT